MKALCVSMILSSVAFLGPVGAYSQSAAIASESVVSADGRIEVQPKAFRGPTLQDYLERVEKIHTCVDGLQIPWESKIVIGDKTIWSVFDKNDFSIYVGIQPAEKDWQRKGVDLDTLTHEYSHAIFEKNLIAAIPDFQARYRVLEEVDMEAHPGVVIYTALHEVFADLLTVTVTKNPETFVELLAPSADGIKTRSYTLEGLLLRSMSLGNDPAAVQKWREILNDESSHVEPYFILLPVRWHFWNLVSSKLESEDYRQSLAAKVFPILKEEAKRMLERSVEPLTTQEIKLLNVRLMNKLSEVL